MRLEQLHKVARMAQIYTAPGTVPHRLAKEAVEHIRHGDAPEAERVLRAMLPILTAATLRGPDLHVADVRNAVWAAVAS